jgi:hypothetical protein
VGSKQDVGSCATSVGDALAREIVLTVLRVQDVQIEASGCEIMIDT